ncbi:MAG: hypothetical protein GY730_06315 [bacterium]|nr:hypothetical protein [bacterium]
MEPEETSSFYNKKITVRSSLSRLACNTAHYWINQIQSSDKRSVITMIKKVFIADPK